MDLSGVAISEDVDRYRRRFEQARRIFEVDQGPGQGQQLLETIAEEWEKLHTLRKRAMFSCRRKASFMTGGSPTQSAAGDAAPLGTDAHASVGRPVTATPEPAGCSPPAPQPQILNGNDGCKPRDKPVSILRLISSFADSGEKRAGEDGSGKRGRIQFAEESNVCFFEKKDYVLQHGGSHDAKVVTAAGDANDTLASLGSDVETF